MMVAEELTGFDVKHGVSIKRVVFPSNGLTGTHFVSHKVWWGKERHNTIVEGFGIGFCCVADNKTVCDLIAWVLIKLKKSLSQLWLVFVRIRILVLTLSFCTTIVCKNIAIVSSCEHFLSTWRRTVGMTCKWIYYFICVISFILLFHSELRDIF